MKSVSRVALTLLSLCGSAGLQAQTIEVIPLHAPPVLDAQPAEWADHPGQLVPLQPLVDSSVVEASEVLVKAGYFGDQVIFYMEWPDAEADLLHKPYVWSEQRGKYVKGPQREDRLALQFGISGTFDANWLSGNAFKADMWHWKSSRSNPLGLAHDKMTTVSTSKLLRGARMTAADGSAVYVLRQNDAGSDLYRTARYSSREEAVMPKYVLLSEAEGSIADIAAKGVWRDGRWHLEMLRKMDTGHTDDVVFQTGQRVKGAISVFDRSENEDHKVSATLDFQF